MLYQIKIQKKGASKSILWRRILIPSETSFAKFHLVLRKALGLKDSMDYSFTSRPEDGEIGWRITRKEEKHSILGAFLNHNVSLISKDIAIEEFLNPVSPKIIYTFDYLSGQIFNIELEKADVKDCVDPEHAHCAGGGPNLTKTVLEEIELIVSSKTKLDQIPVPKQTGVSLYKAEAKKLADKFRIRQQRIGSFIDCVIKGNKPSDSFK